MTVKCRYIMYTEDDRSKGYRLDVENDGKKSELFIGGELVHATRKRHVAMLEACSAMDIALGNLLVPDGDLGGHDNPLDEMNDRQRLMLSAMAVCEAGGNKDGMTEDEIVAAAQRLQQILSTYGVEL